MKPKTKSKAKPGTPEIAENQKSAAAMWGIPIEVQRAAKARGCQAFKSGRVHRKPLLAWIKRNAAALAAVEKAAGERRSDADLKRERLAIQIEHAQFSLQKDKGLYTLTAAAQADWLTAAAIYQEEAKSLMERDHYRIYVDRVYARLEALNHCRLPQPGGK
ncbi:MAG: hypothetical protein NTW21_16520 [Verrucomicrobia bacterium]|nr:hypothetical protein [Verrucomicrobiota bacterium]